GGRGEARLRERAAAHQASAPRQRERRGARCVRAGRGAGRTHGGNLGVTMSTSPRPRIAALVPMVWSVRNVVYTGLLDRLKDGGADVHLILRHGEPAPSEPGYPAFAAAAGIHPLLIPTEQRVRGKAFIDGVV